MLKYHEPHECGLALCTERRSCIEDRPTPLRIGAELEERAAITGSKG